MASVSKSGNTKLKACVVYSWQLQYTYEMSLHNLHAVEAGLWLYSGKLQADHHHLTISLINCIHTLNSKVCITLDRQIGNTLNMQPM